MNTTDAHGWTRRSQSNVVLWTLQALLAALFLFAGAMKLVLPIEAMGGPIPLPGAFLRFLGVAEVLGAIGLIAPGALHMARGLTPIAAGALAIVMVGATEITVLGGSLAGAVVPFVVGVLLTAIVYGRRAWLPSGVAQRRLDRSAVHIVDAAVRVTL